MKTEDFNFTLNPSLIAEYPLEKRSDARLLVYQKNAELQHLTFASLTACLRPNDLLVVNNSKVIPARFFGKKETGGEIECLVERMLSENTCLLHLRVSKPLRPGQKIILTTGELIVIAREKGLYHVKSEEPIRDILENIGEMPLPPYITRNVEGSDRERYQTVYAEPEGSIAAPTAGLHFDDAMLLTLRAEGVQVSHVTLHVGSGTFRPVRVASILEHDMHSEYCEVSAEVVLKIQETKARGGRVIAVGTTALRSLETAALSGILKPFSGETNIFIYPGFHFRVCDGLITNFHLPASTLIMLVSAFIGHQETMALYEEAMTAGYRFFSYGDTSLLWR